MAFVVAVTWVAREGEEERVAQKLRVVAEHTRAEPGCLMYVAQRSVDDPRQFFLYEQYEDEAAFDAHRASEHFKRDVLGDAVPLLETRERQLYETLD